MGNQQMYIRWGLHYIYLLVKDKQIYKFILIYIYFQIIENNSIKKKNIMSAFILDIHLGIQKGNSTC
jgi:hypothetical protein